MFGIIEYNLIFLIVFYEILVRIKDHQGALKPLKNKGFWVKMYGFMVGVEMGPETILRGISGRKMG